MAAAIRSTWSPCGQSMLSTITPLGEQGRGNRFRTTAIWFILGATLGGATLGLGAAVLAAVIGATGLATDAALAIGALLATAAAVADAGLFGIRIPYHRRQVNELWLDDYRPWVYGGGFGFQIGLGFATYIMTSALVLLVALAALTGNPLVALALGTLFGFGRGLGVLPGARLDDAGQARRVPPSLRRPLGREPAARDRRRVRRRGRRHGRRRWSRARPSSPPRSPARCSRSEHADGCRCTGERAR